MRTQIARVILFAALAVTAVGQGPLTPPGAPAPTFKTLQQIEPRVPITNIPFTINVPGSYYLTTNFTGVAGTGGVTIASSDVTLDLSGFLLKGVVGSDDGVSAIVCQNVTVRNGMVANWSGNGVNLANAANGVVEGICARSNTLAGISVGSGFTVRQCIGEGNESGIRGIDGCVIQACTARNNGANGMGSGGFNCMFFDCTATENGEDGISSPSGNHVSRCATSFNAGDGIEVASACLIENNLCRGNGSGGDGAGIRVTGSDNRIDSNQLIANDQGLRISVGSGGNLIVRNSASGNGSPGSSNYVITTAGNSFGTVTVSGPFTNTNPWANFEF